MFYVWHTGEIGIDPPPGITLVGPEKLARMIVDAGLSSWIRQKVA